MSKFRFLGILVFSSILLSNVFAQNGGWEQYSYGFPNIWYHDLEITSQDTGYVPGFDDITDVSFIHKTTNAGGSWLDIPVNIGSIFLIEFFDSYNGICSSDSGIFKTSDGGFSWIKMPSASLYDILKIEFISEDTVYFFTENEFYKSFNGGDSLIPNSFISDVTTVEFINGNEGLAISSGSIAKTIYGGNFWIFPPTSIFPEKLKALFYASEDTVYAVGENGLIIKSIDSGDTWIQQNSNVTDDLNALFFVSADTGYVVGGTFFSTGGVILKTTDGGNTWVQQTSNSQEPLFYVSFFNSSDGFALGWNGMFLKTTTGGVVSLKENQNQISLDFTLSQNYPNPFNPSTSINYELGNGNYGKAKLTIFNTLGKKVKDFNLTEPIGSVDWNGTNEFGKNVSSGTYFYRIETPNNFSETQKMILLK